MSAPTKNQNATKDAADKATSFLHIRAIPSDKSAWVKAASDRRKKLAEWVVETLNKASGNH